MDAITATKRCSGKYNACFDIHLKTMQENRKSALRDLLCLCLALDVLAEECFSAGIGWVCAGVESMVGD
jgi:hypothetical protein